MNRNGRRIALSLVAIVLGAGYLLKVIPPETDVGIDDNFSVSIDGSLITNPLDINESSVGSMVANAPSLTLPDLEHTPEVNSRNNQTDNIALQIFAPSPLVQSSTDSDSGTQSNDQIGVTGPLSSSRETPLQTASGIGGSVGTPVFPTEKGGPGLGYAGGNGAGGNGGSNSNSNGSVPSAPPSGAKPSVPSIDAPPLAEQDFPLTSIPGLELDLPKGTLPTSPLPPEWLRDGEDSISAGESDKPREKTDKDSQAHHVPESGNTIAFTGLAIAMMALLTRNREKQTL